MAWSVSTGGSLNHQFLVAGSATTVDSVLFVLTIHEDRPIYLGEDAPLVLMQETMVAPL